MAGIVCLKKVCWNNMVLASRENFRYEFEKNRLLKKEKRVRICEYI
jgi:hypothetical protein